MPNSRDRSSVLFRESSVHLPESRQETRNNGTTNTSPQPDLSDFNFWAGISQVFGLGCLTATLLWILLFLKGVSGPSNLSTWFNWHPILMITGLVVIQGDSILVYRMLRYNMKRRLKLIHAGLHFLAFTFVVWGLKCAFDLHNHATPPSANLQSLHSWIGFGSVLLFSFQFIAGFSAFLFPGFSSTLRARILPLHTFFGMIIFLFSVCAALAGFTQKGGSNPDGKPLASAAAILMLFYAASVLHLLIRPDYKRAPLPED